MSIRKIEDIDEKYVFGRRLFKLGQEIGVLGPAAIAVALYEKDECLSILQPNKRHDRKSEEKKDKNAIARRVQEHIFKENAYDIPGKYMMAYSILFNCSMDYLYGIIDVKCPDASIYDISKKVGLSSDSISVIRKVNGFDGGIFTYEADDYRRIMNSMFCSPEMMDVFYCFKDLDDRTTQYKDIIGEVERKIGKDQFDEAMRMYHSKIDYLYDPAAPELKQEQYNAIRMIETAIDKQYGMENSIKISRYELHEALERLVEALYPR